MTFKHTLNVLAIVGAFNIRPLLAFVPLPPRLNASPIKHQRVQPDVHFLPQCVPSTSLHSTELYSTSTDPPVPSIWDPPVPSIWDPKEGEILLDEFDHLMKSSPIQELMTIALHEVTDPVTMKNYPNRTKYWQTYKDGKMSFRDFFSEWLVYSPLPGNPGEYITYWDWLANTYAGILLTNEVQDFKDWFVKFLDLRGKFINSVESATSIPHWMEYGGDKDHPFNIANYIVPKEGFKTFNQFFLREVKPELRPLAGDDNVIVSPNDGGTFILEHGGELLNKHRDTFDVKDSFPSHGERFVGGNLLNSLLLFTDYHHFTAPVSGKIISMHEFQGSYNYDFDDFDANHPFGPRPGEHSNRVGWYDVIPKHKRFNWVIDTGREDVGLIGMSAIGFWGVGSIISLVNEGDHINKGQPMGHFNYGGSSIVLAFEPKANLKLVAIDNDGTTKNPLSLISKF